MTSSPYSTLKIAHHASRISDLRDGHQVVPVHVHFILSDFCNQDCSFCSYRMSGGFSTELFKGEAGEKNPQRMMPTEKALEIIADLGAMGCRAIQFTGGGEPTVHPSHPLIFDTALETGLDCALVSNGAVQRDETLDLLPNFHWVRYSLDAGDPKTYSAIRRVPETIFPRVLKNLKRLRDAVDQAGSPTVIGVGFVVTRDNWQEVAMATRLARDNGAHNIRLSAVFSDQGADRYVGLEAEIARKITIAKELETEEFQVINSFNARVDDLVQGKPDYEFCSYQQLVLYIGGDQQVYRCCTTSYTTHGHIGDLKTQRFSEWFHSQQKKRAIGDFDARSCHHCQFNDKNRTALYLIEKRPTHVNFV